MVNLGSYFNYAVPMEKKQLTAVSLFAGVGGFDLALERAGAKVVAAVEIDKNARGVLAKQFPNTKLFNDVTTVTGEDLRNAGFIPEHGIITGGFPCQDLSVAGKRAGLAGARSGLFYEIARIADETKAKWLVLENVPGLLSSQRGADMGAVVGTLVDLGYGVAWRVLDAQHFGVPQRRRRVFIVAERAGDPTGCAEILFEPTSLRGDTSQGRAQGQETTGDAGQSSEEPMLLTQREGKPGGGKGPLISIDQSLTLATQNSQVLYDPVGTLTANGFRCDLNKAQSGHLTIGFSHTQGLDAQPSTNVFPTLRVGGGGHAVMEPEPANGGGIMNCLPAELYHHGSLTNQDVNSGHLVIGPVAFDEMNFTTSEKHQTLRAGTPQSTGVLEPEPVIVGPLTAQGMANAKGTETTDSHHYVLEPTLYEPMSAFEENWAESEVKNALRAGASKSSHALIEPTLYEPHHGDGRATEGIANTLAARMGTGGNNTPVLVEPQTFVKVIRSGARDADGNLPPEVWREEQTNPTLNQFDQGDSRTVTAVVAPGTVRRLTPTECERLQGFPDGWTSQRIDEVKGLVTQADSSRYKQMGNAVAVPCVEWIVNRLVAYEQVR